MKENEIKIGLYYRRDSGYREIISHSEYYKNVEWRHPNSPNSRQCKISTFANWAEYRILSLVRCKSNYIEDKHCSLISGKIYPVIKEKPGIVILIDEFGNEKGFSLSDGLFIEKLTT